MNLKQSAIITLTLFLLGLLLGLHVPHIQRQQILRAEWLLGEGYDVHTALNSNDPESPIWMNLWSNGSALDRMIDESLECTFGVVCAVVSQITSTADA